MTLALRTLPSLWLLAGCAAQDVSVGSWVPDSSPREADAAIPVERDAQAELPDAEQEAAVATLPYIEAESAQLSGGFVVGASTTASAGAFLQPPAGAPLDDQPGPARASYTFAVPRAGDYVIWGRIRSPSAATNRFWFQLDDGPFTKWRISVGDIWYWDTFHDDTKYGTPLVFSLAEGTHRLTLANCVENVGLDRLYITADGDKPPGNDTPCRPPHSIEIAGACLPSCGAQSGNKCGEVACSGLTLIDAYDCDVCCHAP